MEKNNQKSDQKENQSSFAVTDDTDTWNKFDVYALCIDYPNKVNCSYMFFKRDSIDFDLIYKWLEHIDDESKRNSNIKVTVLSDDPCLKEDFTKALRAYASGDLFDHSFAALFKKYV